MWKWKLFTKNVRFFEIHEKSLLPHIEAPYSITDITSESNSLVNVEYSKPPLAIHLVISKPNDLLADYKIESI
jgi:hypothetical protein